MSKKTIWEMADEGDTEGLVLATQRSFARMVRDILADLKAKSTSPGMTWEQIEFLITHAAEKKPQIVKRTVDMETEQ